MMMMIIMMIAMVMMMIIIITILITEIIIIGTITVIQPIDSNDNNKTIMMFPKFISRLSEIF